MDIALRAVFLYAFVVFLMRVMGRRELSSLSPLDLVLLIVLGDAIQQGLTQDDYSVTGAILAVATVATLQVFTSYVSYRSKKARTVTEDEVAEEMRQQQIASLDDVDWAIVEANGAISFIKKN